MSYFENEYEVYVDCDCGCGEGLKCTLYKPVVCNEELPEYVLSFSGSDFYHEGQSRLGRRIRRAWNGITGKDKYLTEFILQEKEMKQFISKLSRLCTERPKDFDAEFGWCACPECGQEIDGMIGNDDLFCPNCGTHLGLEWLIEKEQG